MNEQVFVRRCRVCSHEIKTPWGPETHTESARALADHIRLHKHVDLMEYVLREHLGMELRHA